MKVIVVSGARSNTGKTRLAREVCRLLPSAVRIKIGHGIRKEGDDGYFYPAGTSFETIAARHNGAGYLVIESNSILKHIVPDCTIYLAADDPKPSAAMARERADVLRGEALTNEKISHLAQRLGCCEATVMTIAGLAGAERAC